MIVTVLVAPGALAEQTSDNLNFNLKTEIQMCNEHVNYEFELSDTRQPLFCDSKHLLVGVINHFSDFTNYKINTDIDPGTGAPWVIDSGLNDAEILINSLKSGGTKIPIELIKNIPLDQWHERGTRDINAPIATGNTRRYVVIKCRQA